MVKSGHMSTTADNLKAANKRHLMRIAALEKRIDEIREQAASASISAGGGSRSYTNQQLSALRAEIREHQAAISRNNARLAGTVGRRVYIGRR